MDDRQVLLVKLSWSNMYRKPEQVEAVFLKKLKDVEPDLRRIMQHAQLSRSFASTLNHIVLNIQQLNTIKPELHQTVKTYSECGFNKEAFNSLVIAFLLSLKSILGNNWTMEIQNSWVMAIATVWHRYQETMRRVPQTVII